MIPTAAMPPLMMRSDFDPVQVAIIVMAVIFGFIKWLWENWQQKRASAPPAEDIDPEERRMREAAWRRQTGQEGPPPVPQAPAGPVESPWAEVRKAWEELKEAAQRPERPAPARPVSKPPPMPQQRSVRGALAASSAKAVSEAAARPRERAPVIAAPAAEPPVSGDSMLAKLQGMRSDPALMRQAILMQAILGPPKALQTIHEPAI
ncbi:MAG: hypothetical protein IAE77_06280 [Prosthecobacter sp.]|jgi:hypothetical protein|uniref:hypothetical protein n=1 Tax=Prosthecobacter sp. TaxID=1965333 RepID=UPI001A041415|nr:hypothetical protein [Prosthecobacter sp.]MBE2283048.1 hypothetical protein [Prosthecobacter sp.]